MHRTRQLELLDRMFAHRDAGYTTDLVEHSHAEPVTNYTCPDRYDVEVDALFHREPVVAALSCDVANPGDFLTMDLVGVPLLIVRQDDGTVAAFRNVCRHRGATVAAGRGNARRFTCPYHAWSYARDGSIAQVSSNVGFTDVDIDQLELSPVACDEAAGMVFVRLSGEAFDAREFMGPLFDDLEPMGLESFVPIETRVDHRRMNWKLMYDTFGEAYHIGTLHRRTIAPLIRSDCSTHDELGPHGLFVATRRSFEDLDDVPRAEWSVIPHGTLLYLMVPNTVFVYQQDHVELWQILPDAVDACRAVVTLYAPEAPADDRAMGHWTRNLDLLMEVTGTEDFIMCEQIQSSFSSGAQDHITFGRNEPGLQHFHRSVNTLVDRATARPRST